MIKRWLERRAARARERDFTKGYNYAAGALLSGLETSYLMDEIDCCDIDIGDGIFAAISDHQEESC